MTHQPNLDTVEIEIAFYPVLGVDTSTNIRKPNAITGPGPRIFQHGTIAGRPASKTILSADNPGTFPFGKFAEEESREDFEARIARYDADARWSRTRF